MALVAAVLIIGLSSPALAQSSIGFSGGASVDPGQVYAGVYWQSPDIAGRFRLRPGLDGGFGDDLRVATVNLDFIYLLPLGNTPWQFATGGGPAIVIWKPSNDFYDFGTEVHAGFSYLFGFAHENGFFTEIRMGGGDAPRLKLGVGWSVKID